VTLHGSPGQVAARRTRPPFIQYGGGTYRIFMLMLDLRLDGGVMDAVKRRPAAGGAKDGGCLKVGRSILKIRRVRFTTPGSIRGAHELLRVPAIRYGLPKTAVLTAGATAISRALIFWTSRENSRSGSRYQSVDHTR